MNDGALEVLKIKEMAQKPKRELNFKIVSWSSKETGTHLSRLL